MKALGNHLIIELYECSSKKINDLDFVESTMLDAARKSGAEIIKYAFHKFNPHGVSGIIVIAESHFSIHTWPEYGYCALDIFTCGDTIKGERALKYLKKEFKAKNISVVETKRGLLNLPVHKIKHKVDA